VSRSVEVLGIGPSALVQDAGRPGYAHLGVPRSGWLDGPSARLANRLVGNPEDSALIECLLGGLRLRAGSAMTVAVTGAGCPVRAGGRPAAFGEALSMAAGDELVLGAPVTGLRCYVALSGGLAVEPVLGSRSTDTLSGTGPEPLTRGITVPVGPAVGEPGAVEAQGYPATEVGPRPIILRCWPGPRADWFGPTALDTFTSSAYTVDADSDRIGLRLDGPTLARVQEGELPSEGVVLGSVQVPADGRPLVFLGDHPTTGGYPVLAVVDEDDLARCAQLRPGDEVRFRWRAGTPAGSPAGAPAGSAGPGGAG